MHADLHVLPIKLDEVPVFIGILAKGGQEIGDAILPFDDVEQASVAVAALDGKGL